MKCSLGISNFLEVISSLSHSVVFLYFFALIAEEAFFISPCYSLELCIQMGISFLFSFAFHFSSFHSLFVRPPQTAFCFFAFFSHGDGLDPEKCKSKLQCSITSHQSDWPASKSLQITNAGEGVEERRKRNPPTLFGNVIWYSHYGKQYGGPLKN